jgi:hypothetical protein
VLRLLSLVIYDLSDKKIPFIRLGDFDLGNSEIRRELIKHIGQEWDSIVAQDITSREAGAKVVDDNMGSAYKAYKLGTIVARTIFMYSHSGRGEKGANIREIKISACQPELSSAVIDSVINGLKERLFYLSDEGLYFTNRPNLNRILLTREENIAPENIIEEERTFLEKFISKRGNMAVYIWPENHRDIPDNRELKLIILKDRPPDWEFIEKHGETPRIYRNVLIFLAPDSSQKPIYHDFLRKLLALRSIESDEKLNLTESQKKETKNKIKNLEQRAYEELRKCYRNVYVPIKNTFREIDLGFPTFGETFIDKEIYLRLRSEGEILEKISAAVIKEKYLKEREYISTKNLLEIFWKMPGEIRLISEEGFKEGVSEGVERGIFGLGYIEAGKPVCKYFKQKYKPEFSDSEIILTPEICAPFSGAGPEIIPLKEDQKPGIKESPPKEAYEPVYKIISLKVEVPLGRMIDISKIIYLLNIKFAKCQVKIEINAEEGEIAISDYENKIKEALSQSSIKIIDEKKE